MSSIATVGPRTLADVIPGGLVRNIVLVVGGAGLVGLTAQVSFPLPFTPVPVTLQTFSVLLVGAVLGSRRGAASMGLYLLAGVVGVPWFSEHRSGWAFGSFGYIVGFVVAAYVVGLLAERRADRKVLPAIGMMTLGNLIIYVFGVTGLVLLVPMPPAHRAGRRRLPVPDLRRDQDPRGGRPAARHLETGQLPPRAVTSGAP